jgi:hypothetical protein
MKPTPKKVSKTEAERRLANLVFIGNDILRSSEE